VKKRDADALLIKHNIYSHAAKDFRPLHDRILIRFEPRLKEDGLIVTTQKEHSEVQMEALVISVGNEVRDVKPGDTVACIHDVLSSRVYSFEADGHAYEEIRESDVLGVVEQ
jgi:co-chaperonin GroES (HSP10)